MTPRNTTAIRPSGHHTLICGPTGTGKSVTMLTLNAYLMKLPLSRRPAMLWIDLHGATVEAAGKLAVKWGITPRSLDGEPTFIWDEGAATSGVPASQVIIRSVNPDLAQRIAENRVAVEELIAVNMQLEGRLNADNSPIILDGMTAGGNLLVWQDVTKPPKPPMDLQHCYRMSWQFRAFERDLTGPKRDDILRTFYRYHELDARQWEYLCGPAVRRWRRLGESQQFAARYDREHPIDKRAFFNRGGIWMYSGASHGNLSRADNSLLAGTLHLEAIQIARSGGLTRDLVIVFDEPVHGGSGSLLNLHFVRNLAEGRKWRIRYGAIAVQNPLSFEDPRIGEELFANCKTVIVHKQTNPRACEFLAEMFAQRHFNALEVHFVEQRYRTVEEDPRRWERVETESKTTTLDPEGQVRGEGTTTGFVFHRPRKEVVDQVEHYKAPQVLTREWQQKLAALRTGQALIRDGDDVTRSPVNIPMLEEPWKDLWFKRHPRVSLADEKLRLAIELMRRRSEYQATPGGVPCPPSPPAPEAGGPPGPPVVPDAAATLPDEDVEPS